MTEGTGDRRPPQVTGGAALVVVCGVLLVATVFDTLTGLHSVDTRAQLARALDQPAARRLGVTVADATRVLHGVLLVGGAAAAVAVVLGAYAYLRHVGARNALVVVAVLGLLGSFPADPLLGVLLVLGAALLWSTPARIWFRPELRDRLARPDPDPRPGPDADPPGVDAPAVADRRAPVPPPTVPPSAGPRPTYGFGTAPVPPPAGVPGPYGAPPGWIAPGAPEHLAPGHPASGHAGLRERPPAPGSVKAAVALTWTCCVLALVGLFAAAAVLANDRARVLDLLRQQPGYDRFAAHEDAIVGALWFLDGAFAVWTLAAAVLAVFVLRGHEWARILLVVSAGAAALVALAAFPASVFHVIGGAVVLGLLLSRSATAWFRQRRALTAPVAPRQDPPVW